MSEQEEKIVLSRSDLYLVMESYRNNIALNTTLIEQQKQILILQNDIVDKQQELANTLRDIAQNGKDLIKKQEDVLQKTRESAESFETCAGEISNKEGSILKAQQELNTTIEKFKSDLINAMKLDRSACSQDHLSLKNNIRLIIGTFSVITLSLIGLATALFSKYNVLDNIHNTLDAIQKILDGIQKLG